MIKKVFEKVLNQLHNLVQRLNVSDLRKKKRCLVNFLSTLPLSKVVCLNRSTGDQLVPDSIVEFLRDICCVVVPAKNDFLVGSVLSSSAENIILKIG